ncbi:MAG: hypothetical protein EPO68_16975 [Planctomycetota bacterium]|nr:MAG: hypothetical protein EPO68_16975 [Planctomycetota bacterium]
MSVTAADVVAQSDGAPTFVSRNGGNLVGCGPTGGPSIWHTFATPTPTSDSIAVSDPGNLLGSVVWGASMAASQLDALPSPNGLALAASGTVSRDALPPLGFGTAALADARDDWSFTLSEPVHFTLNVSLSATSTEAVVAGASFFFVGTSITPDAGSPPAPYSAALSAPGTFTLTTSGTLGPGLYLVNMQNRADSVFNSWPFSGSYQSSFTLALQPLAHATTRNVAPNPLSYTASAPILGQAWSGNVDLALTGHSFAQIFASFAAAQLPLASGQVLLINPPFFELTPPLPGPLATFSTALPGDPALAGIFLATQALHSGGAPSFALSNAVDLTLGF